MQPHRRPAPAFTLVELLVVIAIIVALLAILIPSMGKAIAVSESAVCLSQQRQIAQAALQRAADHYGELPVQNASQILWLTPATRNEFNEYISSQGTVFYCPTLIPADWGIAAGTIGAANVGKDPQWYWEYPTAYGGRFLIGYFYLGNPTLVGANPNQLWADTVGQVGVEDDYVVRVSGKHSSEAALVADGMLRPASGSVHDATLRHPGGGSVDAWVNHALIDGSATSRSTAQLLPRHGGNNALNNPAFW